MSNKTIRIQLVKSLIGTRQSHRATVRGLGLRRLNSQCELQDTAEARGMINRVSYLLKLSARAFLSKNGIEYAKTREWFEISEAPRGAGNRERSWKTAGRGHKGQKSRAGGFHKIGFEGGQMPLQRRLPKRGFTSLTKKFIQEVRLSELQKLTADEVDLSLLKQAGIVSVLARQAKIIATGELKRKVSLRGLRMTKGARIAIEAAGGSISDL